MGIISSEKHSNNVQLNLSGFILFKLDFSTFITNEVPVNIIIFGMQISKTCKDEIFQLYCGFLSNSNPTACVPRVLQFFVYPFMSRIGT